MLTKNDINLFRLKLKQLIFLIHNSKLQIYTSFTNHSGMHQSFRYSSFVSFHARNEFLDRQCSMGYISRIKCVILVVSANLRPWSDHEFNQKSTDGPLILKYKL